MSRDAHKINQAAALAIAVLGPVIALFVVIGSLPYFGAVNDLPQYYTAASMMLKGRAADIYNTQVFFAQEHLLFPSLTRGVALFVPPPGVFLFLPLALLPNSAAPYVWVGILAGALAASVWLMVRWLKLERGETLWLIGLLFLSGPAVESLRIGQLAPLMLLGLVGFLALNARREALSALVLEALVLKPQQFLPVFIFLAAAWRKRTVLAVVIISLALSVLSLLVFGIEGLSNYWACLMNPDNLQYMQPGLNPTFRGQLIRLAGSVTTSVNVISGILLLAAWSAIAWLGAKNRAADWLPLCLIVALPVGLVTSLHCHDYDLLLLVPGLVLLPRTALWSGMRDLTKCAFMIGLAAFLLPFYNDIHYGYLLRGGVVNPHFLLLLLYASYVLVQVFRAPQLLTPVPRSPVS